MKKTLFSLMLAFSFLNCSVFADDRLNSELIYHIAAVKTIFCSGNDDQKKEYTLITSATFGYDVRIIVICPDTTQELRTPYYRPNIRTYGQANRIRGNNVNRR